MAIVKQYHKDTNTTYVYESKSYWDAEKGQSRSKRRVIGKIDPDTGEIIPTGKRGRTKKAKPALPEEASAAGDSTLPSDPGREQILQMELMISSLKARVSELEDENRKYRQALDKASSLASRLSAACQPLQPE